MLIKRTKEMQINKNLTSMSILVYNLNLLKKAWTSLANVYAKWFLYCFNVYLLWDYDYRNNDNMIFGVRYYNLIIIPQ